MCLLDLFEHHKAIPRANQIKIKIKTKRGGLSRQYRGTRAIRHGNDVLWET